MILHQNEVNKKPQRKVVYTVLKDEMPKEDKFLKTHLVFLYEKLSFLSEYISVLVGRFFPVLKDAVEDVEQGDDNQIIITFKSPIFVTTSELASVPVQNVQDELDKPDDLEDNGTCSFDLENREVEHLVSHIVLKINNSTKKEILLYYIEDNKN
jgi:hypothetical protein